MVVLIDTIFFPFGPILLIFVEHLESVLKLSVLYVSVFCFVYRYLLIKSPKRSLETYYFCPETKRKETHFHICARFMEILFSAVAIFFI